MDSRGRPLPRTVGVFLATRTSPSIVRVALVACLVGGGQFLVGVLRHDHPSGAFCEYLILCANVDMFEFPVFVVLDYVDVGKTWVKVEVVLCCHVYGDVPVFQFWFSRGVVFVNR